MNKLYSAAIGVFAVTLIASAAEADGPDTSAQGCYRPGKAKTRHEDGRRGHRERLRKRPLMEGHARGEEVYCPPHGLKGGQVMTTLTSFL